MDCKAVRAGLAGVVSLALLTIGTGSVAADKSSERPYPISTAVSPGLQTFLRLNTDVNVFNVNYHYGSVKPAPDGAYLQNVNSSMTSWYIEDQRYGDIDVIGGVLHDNRALLETGLKMFDYGLNREAPNGSFPGSFGLFHGTAMFLAQAGPAMLILQNWYREPSLGSVMAAHIRWEISRMRAAAEYLARAWWAKPGHIDDGGKEERKFEGAVALESIGVLSGDKRLQQASFAYAREADAMTEPNGIWTEHGTTQLCCHDSSYQAIGLTYGLDYLALIGPASPLYQAVDRSVRIGETWEFSRTRPGGTVVRAGDDRTGPTCPERSVSGRCKALDLVAVLSALMRWGVLTNDNAFIRRAYMVALVNNEHVTGEKLPAPSLFVYPRASMTIAQIGRHYVFFVGGTRYEPLEPVRIYFAKTLVGTVTTDQSGNFGGHSPVSGFKFGPPPDTSAGVYTITGQGAYGTVRRCRVTIVAA